MHRSRRTAHAALIVLSIVMLNAAARFNGAAAVAADDRQSQPADSCSDDGTSSRDPPSARMIGVVPFRIAEPGYYRLADDVAYEPAAGSAISIEADNVALDLNGKTLQGTAGPETSAIGISALDRQNVTVTNGRVAGFYFGIDIRGTSQVPGVHGTGRSKGHTISKLVAERNWYFGIRLVGSQSKVAHCRVLDTGGSTKPAHTIPHAVRLVGPENALRHTCIRDVRLKRFADGRGEIVAVHFDAARNSVLENNVLIELHTESDSADAVTADTANTGDRAGRRERRFGVWVNAGSNRDTFLKVHNNVFTGFDVPLAFTPGSTGRVTGNVFHTATPTPIRGQPAAQLLENAVKENDGPTNCGQLSRETDHAP